MRFCNAMSNFDKCHYICCLRAEFATKHTKSLSSLTTRGKMEPDFASWQSPDISRSHLYHRTIAWTPPTAINRECTVVWVIMRWRGYPQNIGVLVVLVRLGCCPYSIQMGWQHQALSCGSSPGRPHSLTLFFTHFNHVFLGQSSEIRRSLSSLREDVN